MNAPRDRLSVVAHFPGRLRVRADTFRVLPEVAAEVVAKIGAEPGVASASASSVTGSLLILYDPHETQLLRLLRAIIVQSGLHGIEVDERAIFDAVTPGQRVRRVAGDLDARVRRATGGNLDVRVGVPSGLALLGIGKLLAGNWRTPEWYDLLFWSFVTFSNLNPPSHAATPDAPGD